jgi:amino acid adenylation domain-containing protein
MARLEPDPLWTTGPPCTLRSEGLHEAFARTAASRPHAAALVAGDRTTTYGELDRTADAWAAELKAAGVAPGDRVPILLPRGAELVTALLAVLKVGAAYALLDPSWPTSRLRDVTGQLAAPLLVSRFAAVDGRVWVPPVGPIDAPAGFRPAAVEGSAACSVFFTSGTSGRPKGAVTPHRATARLFQPDGFARFAADTVMPLAAPVPWDAFSLELWSVLLNGGTSLIVDEPYLSAASLRGAVSGHGANTVWLTSSLFNMIVDEDPEAFQGLRQVITGGERLSVAHVDRFLRRHPAIALINGYGPVESTVFATTHRITAADCERPGGIPLGRPVTGTQVHVLDGSRVCTVGETGEICIAGDGLALGYVADAALTDAKFTRVLVAGRPVRVYRTGDLGAWGPDGLLRFGGRADRQLKVRGHRIEPGDIERRVVGVLPAVRACRVLARQDGTGAAVELVGFCVPVEPGDPLNGALSQLSSALLPHERPVAVVSVDAFPVTANGKLDERALLAVARTDRTGAVVRGRDELECLVEETFRSVLDRTSVPLDVSFFELGGGSLGAGRVCARIAARLDTAVPLSEFYRHPTVGSLAGWLRTATPPATATSSTDQAVPLTPMQLVFLTRYLLDPSELTSLCQLTWVVEGELDRDALGSAVVAVHRRHEPLRAAYVADPRPAARPVDIAPPTLVVLAEERSVDAAIETVRGFLAKALAVDEGQVWRTALVPVGARTVFGCVVHHIAFDGWSESVLAKDLAAAYNARRDEPAAPSLSTVYRRYAERAARTDLVAQRDRVLAELTGVPDLRWPGGDVERAPGVPGLVEVPLAPTVVASVDAEAAEAGVTRFVVLLSHYAATLAEVTGQRDFAVGVPVAQRGDEVLERVVGCHINMVCVRLRGAALDGDAAAHRATGRVVGRAFATQDLSLGDVIQLVNRPRTGRPPLFQTLFAVQDNAIPRLELSGLRSTFLRQSYLDIPVELHAELWPDGDGGLRLTVYFRREAVPEPTARELAKRFTDRLSTACSGARR